MKHSQKTYKVMVLTRKYHGLILGSGSGFASEGNQVFLSHIMERPEWNLYIRAKHKLGFSIDDYLMRRVENYGRKMIKVFDELKPDIVYVVQGTQLLPEVIDYFSKSSLTVVDMCDPLSAYPQMYEYVKHYDAAYSYNKDDCDELQRMGIFCQYVPTGTDTGTYHPMHLRRDIDVSFVGVMYEDRLEYLTRLALEMPQLKLRVWGPYAPVWEVKRFLKWLTNKRLRECFLNKNILRFEVNKVYNRSKICLNMNRDIMGNGWSDRFANIAATGSFQLVTHNDLIAERFSDSVGTFRDCDELKEKIAYYLERDALRNEMAATCYDRFLQECQHTGFNMIQDIYRKADEKSRSNPKEN